LTRKSFGGEKLKRNRQATYILLAILLIFPFGAIPASAQLDATPELSFDLWVLSWDDISVDTGSGIRTQLDEIGIEINVVITDDDPMYTGIYAEPREFTLYEMSHGYGSVPDHVWWRMHSENIIDWGDNCYGIDNATVDDLLDDFMASTPATLEANARAVQIAAKDNIPYIPLYLSDDTHAIRSEWTNYTLKPGGVFTDFNPQTVIFMYDTDLPSPMDFVMAYPSDIGELNPIFARSARSTWYDMLVYDTLISFDNDLNPIPWLAESFVQTSDGLQVNFTIRTGVTWHDGQPLTPDDVEFSINYYKNAPEDANQWSFLQHISSIDVEGQVVSVNLDQPFAFGLQNLGVLYMYPQHVREGIPADDARWDDHTNVTAQTGSGPFVYDSRSPDEFTLVTKFADWWGPDNPYVGQLPNIDSIRIDVVRGQDARILAMRAGDADTERYEVFGAYVNTILNAPELDLVTGLPSQWDYVLGFNTTIPGLDDIDVRKAIAYATNRQGLVNIGRLGHGTVTDNVIPEAFFPGLSDPAGDWYSFNVTIANQILDDAGYLDVDNDGVREFPGVAPPAAGPDLVLLAGIGAGALIVGIVCTYALLKRGK
jgi:peptide/nickel transport system substrate-binding protein